MTTFKNIPLLIGIALPIIFIIIISAVIFIPTLFINPQYNFLYSTDDSPYNYDQKYSATYDIVENRLVAKPLPTRTGAVYKEGNPALFLYDIKNNTSHKIDYSDAQDYYVDPGPSSPDGYVVEYKYNSSGIFELFGSSGNSNGLVVSKGNSSKKLNGLMGDSRGYYPYNFKFIGWVK